MSDDNIQIQALFEGETFSVYRIQEDDGEVGFDVHLFGSVTLHFLEEEWAEFLDVMHSLPASH